MPIYEFVCQKCGTRMEALRRMGEGAEGLRCPECGSGELEQAFSTFASGSSSGARPSAPTSGCGTSGFG